MGAWWRDFSERHHHHCPNVPTVCLPVSIWLRINELAILLHPSERTYVMSQLHVDQTVTLSLQAVDAFGNLVDATFENTQWVNSDEAVAASEISDDGLTCTLTPAPNAVGKSTTVNTSTLIAGTTFTAQVTENVVAGAVAGVMIVETFTPKPASLQKAQADAAAKAKAPDMARR